MANGILPVAAQKAFIMEEDDDFFAASDLAEAERQGMQPSEDEEDLYDSPKAAVPFVASWKENAQPARSAMQAMEELVTPRPGVKEGKQKMLVEEEEIAFGEEDYGEGFGVSQQPAPANGGRQADYTAPYSDLSSVNFNLRPGFVTAAPITATTFDGRRVVFSRRKRVEGFADSAAEIKENSEGLTKLSSSMLEKPYYEMIRDIENDIETKRLAEIEIEESAVLDEPQVETSLWTDRYRPKKFVDLLGDERVHRAALLWLKEWDQCVFKGNTKNTAAAEAKRERRKKRAREGKTFGAAAEGDEERAPDAYGRPFEKLLLLCGPPGLGKTTLAYVLARQAGYQVLEVNASDERNAKVVTDRIRNALESTALTMNGQSGKKPTCIVIDEIDGVDSSFIKTLVKLVMEGSSTRKYKGKGKKDRPLLRPIICICNDLYAPNLRPLRPLARIIRFTPPTNVMLVHRLRTICVEEGLGADSKNLTMLTEIAEGDLRSCLNTLQFIKRRSKVVDEKAIKTTMVGMKDTGTSVSAVWDRLFKKPNRKKGGGSTDEKYVHRLVKDVQTCGEYDKISQGCFENYLGAKQMNDGWTRILEAHDWLYLYDRLDGRLRSDRDYELLAYVPYTFVPWYKLFSSHTAKPLEFPKTDYEAYLKRTAHQEIADAFALSIPNNLKNMFNAKTIASELLPLINRIIAPDLKPINSQLIKTDERLVMMGLVNKLLTMNLSFVQDKDEDGQLSYKLDPPIDVFVHYDGKRAADIAPSRYAVRHLITREIEAESIRRVTGDGQATTAKDIIAAYQTKKQDTGPKVEVREAVDFFGRIIATTKTQTAEEAVAPQPPRKKQRAVYKFHEGFSNAVKVTKRIGDFL